MIALLLVSFIVVTIFLLMFKHIKQGIGLLIMTIAIFFAAGSDLVLSKLLLYLESPDINSIHPTWKQKNVIVLLGGGTVTFPGMSTVKPALFSYSRITEATRLYFLCKKITPSCMILVSGGDAMATGKSEADVYRNEMLALGVSKVNVILESKSMNTYQNAEYSSAIIKSKQFDNVILVTSGVHMRRALMEFHYFNIDAKPVISDVLFPIHSTIPLSINLAMTDLALHEYFGIVQFHVYRYLGWNKL